MITQTPPDRDRFPPKSPTQEVTKLGTRDLYSMFCALPRTLEPFCCALPALTEIANPDANRGQENDTLSCLVGYNGMKKNGLIFREP